MTKNNILKVNNDISWVGVLDYGILNFDIVMETKYGSTYNSYFINSTKKALVETVKESFFDEYFEKISSLCNPEEIEYLICNHTEPDHSGSIKKLLTKLPNITVVGSGQALNYLSEMVELPFKSLKVKDGETLSLGNKTVKFIGAPNLHWPDTMYSYLEEDKVLFTCDSFGAHYCNELMFDDLVGDYSDSYKYYFDVILKPFSKFMLKAIEKIEPLEIKCICTGHGPILRTSFKERIAEATKWSKEYLENLNPKHKSVLVAYVSAYGYTAKMAAKIAEGIKSEANCEVELVDIEHIFLGDLEEKIVRSHGIIIGSPTINQNTLLPIYKLFSVVSPIRDKGKLGASFGSYGWSGEAVGIIETIMKTLKFKIVQEGLSSKFYPTPSKTDKLYEFGAAFAREINAVKIDL